LLLQKTVPDLIAAVRGKLNAVENKLAKTGGVTPLPPPLPPNLFGGRTADDPVQSGAGTHRPHPKRKLKRDQVFLESIQNGMFAMSRLPVRL
jgi:hypothetical protein